MGEWYVARSMITAIMDINVLDLDFERAERTGFPEVVFCPGKTPGHVAEAVERLAEAHDVVLATRVEPDQAEAVLERMPDARHEVTARAIVVDRRTPVEPLHGVVITTAGTSDVPVAEEAAVTAELMGHGVERVYDVGVAGLHRLLSKLETVRSANVVVVVAGMEGALPSVVGGLVSAPLIAVPTSIGYGASLEGITPLLAMMSGCAPGVTVVNIDNGFGAGYAAAMINRLAWREPAERR